MEVYACITPSNIIYCCSHSPRGKPVYLTFPNDVTGFDELEKQLQKLMCYHRENVQTAIHFPK